MTMNVTTGTTDQADTLRLLAGSRIGQPIGTVPLQGGGGGMRVISVTSGKGGVGKSSVTVNLAVALAHAGQRVMVIDADLGLGNIDVLLGLKPSRTLNDVLEGKANLTEVMVEGPGRIMLAPAGSGIQKYTALSRGDRLCLLDELENLDQEFDIIIIDTESGISENVTFFNVAAQDIVLVVSPEPAAIADAYALTKLLTTRHEERHFKVLVNMVRDDREGLQVFKSLAQVVNRFLDVSLDYVGSVVRDELLLDAVRRQRAVVELYPRAAVSRCFDALARNLMDRPAVGTPKGNIQFLFRRYFEPTKAARFI
jgi:flagellar biosynthesis protein FlhG